MNSVFDYALKELVKLEDSSVCSLCGRIFKDPVRIKVCGHYFCEECLKKAPKNICPKCKVHYRNEEYCTKNLAREITVTLQELKQLLGSGSSNLIGSADASSLQNKLCEKENKQRGHSIILYKQKRYKITFVDELCKKINAKGETLLHRACKRNKQAEVDSLLNTNVDFNAQDFAGWTPLHEAVESGSVAIVETLINHGVLIDVPGGEYITPLQKAATAGSDKIVQLLLKHGANIDAIDYFGKKAKDCTKNLNVLKTFEKFENNRDKIDKDHIENILISKQITAFCYYVDPEYVKKLKQHKIKSANEFDPKKVTHFFIKRTHRPSVNIFKAMLGGCTILPQEWINDFLNGDLFVNIFSYTYINHPCLNKGIQRAAFNRLVQYPNLFDGINFFIEAHKTKVTIENMKFDKETLHTLISHGNGKILHRAPTPSTCEDSVNFPFHASKNKENFRCCNYIIYDENNPPMLMYQMPEIKHKSSKWLVDCIMNFAILE